MSDNWPLTEVSAGKLLNLSEPVASHSSYSYSSSLCHTYSQTLKHENEIFLYNVCPRQSSDLPHPKMKKSVLVKSSVTSRYRKEECIIQRVQVLQ